MRQWLIRSVRSSAIMTVAATAGVFAQGPGAGQGAPMTMMQASPLLNAIDVNHDGTIVGRRTGRCAGAPEDARQERRRQVDARRSRAAAEIRTRTGGPGGPGGRGGAAANAGRAAQAPGERSFEVPIPGPTADELLATLLTFDKNKDGKLDKTEVPERQQGIFERGDTDKNGVLDAAELRKLTADQAAAPAGAAGARGGGPGRGGFGGIRPRRERPSTPITTARSPPRRSRMRPPR